VIWSHSLGLNAGSAFQEILISTLANTPFDACGHGLFVDFDEVPWHFYRAMELTVRADKGIDSWKAGSILTMDLLWWQLQ
jgi:hypothetical protein